MKQASKQRRDERTEGTIEQWRAFGEAYLLRALTSLEGFTSNATAPVLSSPLLAPLLYRSLRTPTSTQPTRPRAAAVVSLAGACLRSRARHAPTARTARVVA